MTFGKISVVSSVSQLTAIFASLTPNTVRPVRSDELTASEVKTLNRHFVDNSYCVWVPATRENLEELCKLRLCKEGEQPKFTVGGKGYVMENNTRNRPLTLTRVSPSTKSEPQPTYSNLMSRGLWGAGAGILMFRDDTEILSAQHTLVAAIVADDCGNSLDGLFFLCVFGAPPQFADWSDKGRTRTKIQDSFGDDSLFSESLLLDLQDEITPAGKDSEKERLSFLKIHSKAAECILNRTKGSDISPTGGKLSWSSESALMNRFADGRDTLQRLTVKVWESGKTQDGKQGRTFCSLFNPAIVVTGLVLASNDEDTLQGILSESVVRADSETPEEYAERRITTLASLRSDTSPLQVDWNLVDKVLGLLASSTDNSGELAPVFSDLFERIAKDKKDAESRRHLYTPMSIASMSAFVELVKNIRKDDFTSSVFTVYKKSGAKTDKKYSPEYRNFGGVDVGFINSRKSKDSDE